MNLLCWFRHKWDEWEYMRPTDKGMHDLMVQGMSRAGYRRRKCLRCGKEESGFCAAETVSGEPTSSWA